jgi:hypothetical protein
MNLTALKTITAELPTEGTIAVKACAKLTPKLLAQLATVRTSFLISNPIQVSNVSACSQEFLPTL